MKKARIAVVLLLGIILVPTLACSVNIAKTRQLSTTVVGQGSISPSGGNYIDGEWISLTAIPETDWSFYHWSVNASWSDDNPITICMDSDRIVYAHFRLTPKIIIKYSDTIIDTITRFGNIVTPKPGHLFLVLDLDIENHYYQSIPISSSLFTVVVNGVEYEHTWAGFVDELEYVYLQD